MSEGIDLNDIFRNRLRITNRIKYLDSLFMAGDWADNTNFHPSYQRNYVWSEEKGVYFIESILLGTEFPPLIYFSNDEGYEIIDGRQRYETIHRFLKDEFHLKKSGLKKLAGVEEIVGKKFSQLPHKYQELITNSMVRVMECRFWGKYTQEEEDAVKREFFKRYNSGLIPLKVTETDYARYIDNPLNSLLEDTFKKLDLFYLVNELIGFDKFDKEKIMKRVRSLMVRHLIPIKYFVNNKEDISTCMFDYLSSSQDIATIVNNFIDSIQKSRVIIELVKEESKLTKCNVTTGQLRLMAECLIWAISLMKELEIDISIFNETHNIIAKELLSREKDFSVARSTFSGNIMRRYQSMQTIVEKFMNVDLAPYVKSSSLTDDQKRKRELSRGNTIEDYSFEELRISRPNVSDNSIDELQIKMKKENWIIRPLYQRRELRDIKISSAIIESLLLGMALPPIFVYKTKEGIFEVIDGQQRLLTILGFLGCKYRDFDGRELKSIKHEFKLNLANGILKDLHGKRYADLSPAYQKEFKNSVINLVVIEESKHPEFDPIDLFVRLNSRPFPIKPDTFEMWNSYVHPAIVDTAKDIATIHNPWFYLRRKDTRMENPNLLVTLAYMHYCNKSDNKSEVNIKHRDKNLLDIYVQGDEISIRLKAKEQITRILENIEEGNNLYRFVDSMNFVDFCFINTLRAISDAKSNDTNSARSSSFDSLIGANRGKRTLQVFYALWEILKNINISDLKMQSGYIFNEIQRIINSMSQTKDTYVFKESIKQFQESLSTINLKNEIPMVYLNYLLGDHNEENKYFSMTLSDDGSRYSINKWNFKLNTSVNNSATIGIDNNLQEGIVLQMPRSGLSPDFIFNILESEYFYRTIEASGGENSTNVKSVPSCKEITKFPIPYLEFEKQEAFSNLRKLKDLFKSEMEWFRYFERMSEIGIEQLYWSSDFENRGIDMISQISKLPKASDYSSCDEILRDTDLKTNFNNPDSIANAYMLMAIDIESSNF